MFYYNFETTSEIEKKTTKPHGRYMSAEALSKDVPKPMCTK